ncbi:MAG: hypothetical protein AAF423_01450 [Pseudomonadota bacterium]
MNSAVHTVRSQLRSSTRNPEFVDVIFAALARKHASIDQLIRLITFALPTLFLAAVVFQPWVEAKWMFLDPLTAAELSGDCCHSHYGFVSTAGIILWAATAAICLFTASLLYMAGKPLVAVSFPLLAGMLTGWIGLDDAYLLHETVLPAFGIPQNIVIASYVLLGSLYFIANWRIILQHDFWLLAMGASALALSIIVDTVFHSLNPYLVLLEDSAKFFGIFCWTSFHVTTFAKLLKASLQPTGRN